MVDGVVDEGEYKGPEEYDGNEGGEGNAADFGMGGGVGIVGAGCWGCRGFYRNGHFGVTCDPLCSSIKCAYVAG